MEDRSGERMRPAESGERGTGVGNDWFYSPEAGEICVDVTDLSEEEIRLVHKEIQAACELTSGVRMVFADDPDRGVAEWWIYKGWER